MSHRREQKEALRREREERERQAKAAERRKKLVGYGLGGLLALAALVVVVLLATGGGGEGGDAAAAEVFPDGGDFPEQKVFEVRPAAEAAGCELRNIKGRGEATHTTSVEEAVRYRTNPPVLGRHFQSPAEDGIYGDAPPDVTVPHAMEHGRVVFWVKPSLPEDTRADIAALVQDDDYQMLLIPRSNMPHAVAATAWNGEPAPGGTGRLLLCDEVNNRTFDALAAFRDEHRSQGAEPVP